MSLDLHSPMTAGYQMPVTLSQAFLSAAAGSSNFWTENQNLYSHLASPAVTAALMAPPKDLAAHSCVNPFNTLVPILAQPENFTQIHAKPVQLIIAFHQVTIKFFIKLILTSPAERQLSIH